MCDTSVEETETWVCRKLEIGAFTEIYFNIYSTILDCISSVTSEAAYKHFKSGLVLHNMSLLYSMLGYGYDNEDI